MEPEMRYYDPFIKPLLDKPGSTYRHTQLVGAHAREYWDNYRKLLDDPDLVPDRPALDKSDPKLRKIDTDFLLTGNLWRNYEIVHKSNYTTHTQLLLQHMTYAALTNEIFQRSGLVRMLWWCSEAAKTHVFANNVRSRRTFDTALTMGADVTEVAGVERLEANEAQARTEGKRLPDMDSSILARVKRDMAGRGQEIPSHREMSLGNRQVKVDDDSYIHNSICNITCKTTDDLNAAILDLRNHIKVLEKILPKLKKSKKNGHTQESLAKAIKDTVRYQQSYHSVMSRSKDIALITSEEVRTRMILILDLHLRLINLEANYAAVAESTPNDSTLAARHDEIREVDATCKELIDQYVGAHAERSLGVLIDDLASFDASPPTLQRDRRPYEPLQAHEHEFWPNSKATLLDIMPHERDLSAPDIASRIEGARTCQELLRHLFTTPAATVPASLDRLAPNAAQDLIPMAPAITDARKGGRMDPNKVTVRMLSQEMIEQLVVAFLEWPFRPTTLQMALASAGEGQGEAEEVGEDLPDDTA